MIRLRTATLYLALSLSLISCSEKRYHVPTSSMDPTIPAGSYVVVDRNAYWRTDPVRWDVVTFEPPKAVYPAGSTPPGPKQIWIMRVVGMPGETIDFGGTEVLIGGKPVSPPAKLKGIHYAGLAGQKSSPSFPTTKILLAEDEYFVLGDNTTNAYDSRFWGAVARDRVLGKLQTP